MKNKKSALKMEKADKAQYFKNYTLQKNRFKYSLNPKYAIGFLKYVETTRKSDEWKISWTTDMVMLKIVIPK